MHLVPLARRPRALAALTVSPLLVLSIAFGAPAIGAGPAALAASTASCADPVTGAPTGPATVSATSSGTFGKVLVVGSGTYSGCSLRLGRPMVYASAAPPAMTAAVPAGPAGITSSGVS